MYGKDIQHNCLYIHLPSLINIFFEVQFSSYYFTFAHHITAILNMDIEIVIAYLQDQSGCFYVN
jgi:hypothetical protein